jgi:hypothetical protein
MTTYKRGTMLRTVDWDQSREATPDNYILFENETVEVAGKHPVFAERLWVRPVLPTGVPHFFAWRAAPADAVLIHEDDTQEDA